MFRPLLNVRASIHHRCSQVPDRLRTPNNRNVCARATGAILSVIECKSRNRCGIRPVNLKTSWADRRWARFPFLLN